MSKPRLDVPQGGRGAWLFLFFGLLVVAGFMFMGLWLLARETP